MERVGELRVLCMYYQRLPVVEGMAAVTSCESAEAAQDGALIIEPDEQCTSMIPAQHSRVE